MTGELSPIDKAKFVAAKRAADFVKDGMRVGLGTGSTAAWLVRCLGEMVRDEGLRIKGVPTSNRTAELAREAAEIALGKFEVGVASKLHLEQPAGWAYRVGYRAALWLRRSRRGIQSLEDLSTGLTSCRPPSDARAVTLSERIEDFIALGEPVVVGPVPLSGCR